MGKDSFTFSIAVFLLSFFYFFITAFYFFPRFSFYSDELS